MNKILSIKHIMGFIVFGMFLLLSNSAIAAMACVSPKVPCCPNGQKGCCAPIHCDGSGPCQDYAIDCWAVDIPITDPIDDPIVGPIDPIVELCTTGKKKYTAGSGCDYSTQTCCKGSWCDGDIICATCTNTSETRNCSGNVINAIGGTQKRTRSVTSYCGSCTYGSWGSYSGTCSCETGYSWDNSSQSCYKSCNLTCGTNEYLDEGSCYCCKASDYLWASSGGTGNPHCGLSANTCCTQRFVGGGYGGTYSLPLNMSSCTQFKSTFGLSGMPMLEEACSKAKY